MGNWFQRYKQLKDWTNNKKQKKLSALFGCILKTVFASSDSFHLITLHIISNITLDSLDHVTFVTLAWTKVYKSKSLGILLEYPTIERHCGSVGKSSSAKSPGNEICTEPKNIIMLRLTGYVCCVLGKGTLLSFVSFTWTHQGGIVRGKILQSKCQ